MWWRLLWPSIVVIIIMTPLCTHRWGHVALPVSETQVSGRLGMS